MKLRSKENLARIFVIRNNFVDNGTELGYPIIQRESLEIFCRFCHKGISSKENLALCGICNVIRDHS